MIAVGVRVNDLWIDIACVLMDVVLSPQYLMMYCDCVWVFIGPEKDLSVGGRCRREIFTFIRGTNRVVSASLAPRHTEGQRLRLREVTQFS